MATDRSTCRSIINIENGACTVNHVHPSKLHCYTTSNFVLYLPALGDFIVHRPIRSLQGDEVRLFVLCPGSEAVPIEGYLLHTPLSTAPAYQAVSWAWGDVQAEVQISLNGSMVSVPANLLPALQAFRHEREPIVLWVDTLCINQTNIGERNHQVQLMEQIYSHAGTVLAWLGPTTPESGRGVAWLERFLHPARYGLDIVEAYASRKSCGTGIEDVLLRPWWSRMWVVQELLLAKRAYLCIGRDRVLWPKFGMSRAEELRITYAEAHAETHEETHDDRLAPMRSPFGQLARLQRLWAGHECWATRRIWPEQPLIPSLLQAVMLLRDRECTDPRDRIFAILSLVKKEDALGNLADYSLSVEDVHMRMVLTNIKTYGNLRILSCAAGVPSFGALDNVTQTWNPLCRRSRLKPRLTGTRTHQFPCPIDNPIPLGISLVHHKEFQRFNAGWPEPPVVSTGKGIAFKGFKFDTIAIGGFCLDVRALCTCVQRKIKRGEDGVLYEDDQQLDFCPELVGSEHTSCAHCLVNNMSRLQDSKDSLQPGIDNNLSDALIRTLFAGSEASLGEAHHWQVQQMLYAATSHRSLFKTSEGRLVLGPKYCQPDDIVCIFRGGNVPFVLRKTADPNEETYWLIGEAYVDKAMGSRPSWVRSKRIQMFNIV